MVLVLYKSIRQLIKTARPASFSSLSAPSSRPSPQPWVTCETVPSSLTNTLSLSGLKSLVIMLPGSTTRDDCGRSFLQNAWRRRSRQRESGGCNGGRLTVSDEGPSHIVLPASLLVHSCVLSPPMLSAVTPGTTRGMLGVFFWV